MQFVCKDNEKKLNIEHWTLNNQDSGKKCR